MTFLGIESLLYGMNCSWLALGVTLDLYRHTMLRERLNFAIRYGHEFTLSKLFVALAVPSTVTSESVTLEEHMKALPEETQAMLASYKDMFVKNVVRYMILRSFLLASLILVCALCASVIDGFAEMIKRYVLTKAAAGVEQSKPKQWMKTSDNKTALQLLSPRFNSRPQLPNGGNKSSQHFYLEIVWNY